MIRGERRTRFSPSVCVKEHLAGATNEPSRTPDVVDLSTKYRSRRWGKTPADFLQQAFFEPCEPSPSEDRENIHRETLVAIIAASHCRSVQ
jgi:hypothetical protein